MKILVKGQEITNAADLEWSDDLNNPADSISFTTDVQIVPGSQFALIDENSGVNVMSGIISDYSQSERNKFNYSGFDFGFYLNHNNIIRQFNGIKISDAITTLCREFNIPIGSIPKMSATVKKIYKNVLLSDCFNELLELAQTKMNVDYYYMTSSTGKFNIKKYEVIEDLSAYIAKTYTMLSQNLMQNPNRTVSMQDLKNQIVVVDSASDKITKKITVRDSQSIAKYGLLQHVEEVDKDNKNKYSTIAQNKLKELNRLTTTLSMTMLGDYRMRKGVIMPINNELFDIQGDFLIKSSRHSISDTKELVTVNLEKYDRSKLG